ncbi:MAG TPA: stage II sporulation protein M [Sedimenticola sp.]|nr:stage II sporulation protein M [Sedimenticola sp.]
MNQERFIQRNEPAWRRLEELLAKDGADRRAADFPRIYRRVCQHLALSRSRLYSNRLIERLNDLVLRAHQRLYGSTATRKGRVGAFFAAGFPAAVRREARLVGLAALFFYLPLLGMMGALQINPDLVYTVTDADNLSRMEAMYEPGQYRLGRERDADSDVMAFAFYIYNNTGIGFRAFASGLLLGLGTLFTLLFNGLFIGAIAGHLTRIGYGEPFWSFVSGHSALELTAIVLSGAAGFRLGLAILAPGRRTRLEALKRAGDRAIPVISGAAVMFFLAAFVEAFWSSMAFIAPEIKYAVGIVMWIAVPGYFLLLGRRDGA